MELVSGVIVSAISHTVIETMLTAIIFQLPITIKMLVIMLLMQVTIHLILMGIKKLCVKNKGG